MRVSIVGGGPAGLYLALLLRKHGVAQSVDVHEQNSAAATYGFGITLADHVMARFDELDPPSHRQILEASEVLSSQLLRHPGGAYEIGVGRDVVSVSRLRLLEILSRRCREVGVVLRHSTRVHLSDLDPGSDLIVGADGANSIVRSAFPRHFGTRTRLLTNRFAWYGTDRAFDLPVLDFLRHEGGAYVGHYYRYAPGMSTFVAECDQATWESSGLAEMSHAERNQHAERVFGDALGGHRLIGNHSIWRQFRVVTNDRWHHGKHVLIGDALYTAHFSIGSGTRLAMEDAGSLFEALSAEPRDVPAALERFVVTRQPARRNLMLAAERSYEWYEGFGRALDEHPADFAYGFMARTGRVDLRKLELRAPQLARDWEQRHRCAEAG